MGDHAGILGAVVFSLVFFVSDLFRELAPEGAQAEGWLFLTEESEIRNFGTMVMTMGISTGARYMLDITDTESSALFDVPKSIQKLAKDVGGM